MLRLTSLIVLLNQSQELIPGNPPFTDGIWIEDLVEWQLTLRKAACEIYPRGWRSADGATQGPICIWRRGARQCKTYSVAVRTRELEINDLEKRLRCFFRRRRICGCVPVWRLKRNQAMLALEAERLVRTRRAHRSAVLAQHLRESPARNRVFAGRIVSARASHLTARRRYRPRRRGQYRSRWDPRQTQVFASAGAG